MFVGRQQAGAGTSGQQQQQASKPMSLLIVDEIDILMTKDQSVRYKLWDALNFIIDCHVSLKLCTRHVTASS